MARRLVTLAFNPPPGNLRLTQPAVPEAEGHEELPMEQPKKPHERGAQVCIISRMPGPDVADDAGSDHVAQTDHKSGHHSHDADFDRGAATNS